MLQVERFINHIFSSNSYILYEKDYEYVWMIDAGDTENVFDWLKLNSKRLKGVFITHTHFDHIYGLNKINYYNSDITIYVSEKGKEGLFSDKYNLSFYSGIPFTYKGKNRIIFF